MLGLIIMWLYIRSSCTHVVSQDVILAWYEKQSAAKVVGVDPDTAAKVRAAATPFVDWLREASDEEESEDEE